MTTIYSLNGLTVSAGLTAWGWTWESRFREKLVERQYGFRSLAQALERASDYVASL